MNNTRYTISNHPQQSPEWFADRLGKLTGSKASVILAKGKGKAESVQRRNYRFQLALERISGKSQETFTGNQHTERGTAMEPFARMAYENECDCMVEEAGFASLRTLRAGCSVDGFRDARRGLIEVKCPIPAIHYEYMALSTPPTDHVPQMNHNMWTTGAEFCDFISFNDDMPGKLRLHVIRFERDEAAITAYNTEALVFLAEVDALEKELRAAGGVERQAEALAA